MVAAKIRNCPICEMPCKVRGGGYTHHMKWHERQGDINKDCNTGKTRDIIDTGGQEYISRALHRLLATGACAIAIQDPRMFRKGRIAKPVLFITMGYHFGDPRAVVFGMAGGGCEACKIDDLRVTSLIRVGLQGDLAKHIVTSLRSLLKVNRVDTEYSNA